MNLLLSDNKPIGKCSEDIVLNRINRDRTKEEMLDPIEIGCMGAQTLSPRLLKLPYESIESTLGHTGSCSSRAPG